MYNAVIQPTVMLNCDNYDTFSEDWNIPLYILLVKSGNLASQIEKATCDYVVEYVTAVIILFLVDLAGYLHHAHTHRTYCMPWYPFVWRNSNFQMELQANLRQWTRSLPFQLHLKACSKSNMCVHDARLTSGQTFMHFAMVTVWGYCTHIVRFGTVEYCELLHGC